MACDSSLGETNDTIKFLIVEIFLKRIQHFFDILGLWVFVGDKRVPCSCLSFDEVQNFLIKDVPMGSEVCPLQKDKLDLFLEVFLKGTHLPFQELRVGAISMETGNS